MSHVPCTGIVMHLLTFQLLESPSTRVGLASGACHGYHLHRIGNGSDQRPCLRNDRLLARYVAHAYARRQGFPFLLVALSEQIF